MPHPALRPLTAAFLLASAFLTLLSTPGPAQAQDAPAVVQNVPAVVQATLPDGMHIVCRREPTPLVAVDVFVRVGLAQETPATAGISNLVAHTFLLSNTDTPETVQQKIGALGGNVSVTWQPEWTQLSALTVRDQFQDAASLLTQMLQSADFDPDVLANTRDHILSDLDNRDSDLFQAAYGGLRDALYPDSGDRLPSGGTIATVRRLTRADLQSFYARYYVPSNFVMVVVGDVDPQEAIRTIRADMDGFPRTGRRSDPSAPALPTADPAPVRTYEPDLAESAVMVGYRAAPASSPDYPALLVANALLGGMKTSHLFTDLREKQSLAYQLGSAYSAQLLTGDIAAYVFAPPTRTDPATKKMEPVVGLLKDQLLQEFDRFKTAPPTPMELARAQRYLIVSYKIKHERIEDRAYYLGFAEMTHGTSLFDTDYAKYINAVTAADVQRVAAAYFVHPAVSTIEPDAAAFKGGQTGP